MLCVLTCSYQRGQHGEGDLEREGEEEGLRLIFKDKAP